MGAALVLAAVAVACSSPAPPVAADPEALPFPVGQLGTAIHAKAASGATADVTLNSATWLPAGCAGGWECNVIELTIAGTSPRPFTYDDAYIVSGYGGGDQPFTHPNDDHWLGADYNVNYTKIGKLPPLRKGTVTAGQTAHGFIGYGCNLCGNHDLYIKMIDPDTEHPLTAGPFGVVEAGWKTHT
ncbi:hypothetical protein SKC41_24975 [Mycobacterium sp. 050128]|uniref:hypothetical protein n=1 Tax=Mycobacterium sp. 050128 TaxID=3096112 RepID=UPI002ED7EA74